MLDGLSVERRAAQWERAVESGTDVRVATAATGHLGGFVTTGPSREDDADATVGEVSAIHLHPDTL